MSDPLAAIRYRLPASGSAWLSGHGPGFYFLAAESRAPNPESPVSIPEPPIPSPGS